MRQIKSIAILLLLSVVAPFAALADSFEVTPVDLELGTTAYLRFNLVNTQDYYGFQAEVKLPAGLAAVKDSKGNLDISLSDRAAGGNYAVNSNTLSSGNLIMSTFSGNHTPFTGNDGILVDLKVSVSDTFKGGNVEVSKIIFIDSQNKDVVLETTSTTIGVAATGITLIETGSELKVGETVTLTATVAPESATDKTVTWTSSDETVATVNANGKVTAMAIGEATITATCGAVSATCKVTVVPTPVESLILSSPTLTLTEGDKASLTATVAPATATDKTVTWSTSDESVATVSATGEVTAIKDGTADITATSSNGKTATCTVTVKANIISVTAISISKTELNLTEGDKDTLTAAVMPENTTDPSVTWTSSDEAVAIVSASGEVTAVKPGTATITAASSNGMTASCTVTVKARIIDATGVTLNTPATELKVGETVSLTATVAPENTTDKTVTWISSDEEVATVDDNGKVTAMAIGETTITATCGAVSATCKVTVIPTPVESITLDKDRVTLTEGESLTFVATVTPDDATDKTVTWTSSDETIATVENGVVTAVAAGEATITAKAGDMTAECVINVESAFVAVTEITLDKTEADMIVGDTFQLVATVLPENATDAKIIWTTSNDFVATVDENGNVTAVGLGQAVITAQAGDKTAECTVNVDKSTGIELIGLDSKSTMIVFDLNGVYVSDSIENLQQGCYIIRQGDIVKKIIIRE